MSRIVLPGDKISDKPLRLENSTVEGGQTYATVMGLFDEEKETFIPLESVWYPRPEDDVIGIVEDARNGVYTINLNSPFKGLFISRHEGPNLGVGDVVNVIVRNVKKESDKIIILLVRPRKLYGGKLMAVRPSKVPRIIGKSNTMLKLLTEKTKSTIIVGMNGVVWLKGGDIPLAIQAITKIQEEAHISGLTDRVTNMLSKGSA